MSDDNKQNQQSWPGNNESMLGQNGSSPWQSVNVPAPPTPLPPPPPYPMGQPAQGYGQPQGAPQASYGAPVYGGQPMQPPPAGWPPQGGYAQPNYSQPNYAELAAAAMLASGLRPRRRRRHHWILGILLIFAFLFILGMGGCIGLIHMFSGAGREQVVALHDRMKEGDYASIFASADSSYQQTIGQSRSDEMFRAVHDSLGDPVNYSVRSVNENAGQGEGSTKTLVIKTTFTKGTGTETMRFHLSHGAWKLQRYSCDSPQLKDANGSEWTF